MNEYIKIRISNIAGMPDNFVDEKLVNGRVKRLGLEYVTKVMTDNLFRKVCENISKQHLVQVLMYNVYSIDFLAKENQNIDIIELAEDIEVTYYYDNTETVLNCMINSIDKAKIDDTDTFRYTIKVFDLKDDSFCLINKLDSDTVSSLNNKIELRLKANIYTHSEYVTFDDGFLIISKNNYHNVSVNDECTIDSLILSDKNFPVTGTVTSVTATQIVIQTSLTRLNASYWLNFKFEGTDVFKKSFYTALQGRSVYNDKVQLSDEVTNLDTKIEIGKTMYDSKLYRFYLNDNDLTLLVNFSNIANGTLIDGDNEIDLGFGSIIEIDTNNENLIDINKVDVTFNYNKKILEKYV